MDHFLIVSLSRSGGKLLRMLLDNHPECNVFPFEHWNRPSKNKIPARRMEAFSRMSVETKLETAGASHVERKLGRLHPQALAAAVMQTWQAETAGAETLAAMYEHLAHAYFPAVGRRRDAIVVNHCGSLCRFTRDQLDGVYGEGRHLLTIRDPRAVFSSMQGLLSRKFTEKHVAKGKISASALERHQRKLETHESLSGYLREFCQDYRDMVAGYAAREDVIKVRFEDLVTSPEPAMRRLAAQLAIRWDPTLLEPTQLGISHVPNSSFARGGSAIDERAACDWVGRLASTACRYIEDTLADEMAALGYLRMNGNVRPVRDRAPLLSRD